jgi:hypothetical protein
MQSMDFIREMKVVRFHGLILWAFFLLSALCIGCTCPACPDTAPKFPPISGEQRRALLNDYLCPQIAKEDAANSGIRPNGKGWTLASLAFDASTAYAKEQLHSNDVTQARRMMASMLAAEQPSISLAELCHRSGSQVASKNQGVDEPLAAIVAICSM